MPTTRATPTIALTLACATGLVACSGESDKPAPASTSTTSASPTQQSTTPTTTTATPKTTTNGYKGPVSVPVAARARTDAGRIAFAKHYIDQINETGKNPKVGVLEPLALPSCKTCANFASTVKSLETSGRKYKGNSFTAISSLFPKPTDRDIVEIIVDSPRLQVLNKKGIVYKVYPGDKRAGLVFYLGWFSKWIVKEIKIDDSSLR